MSTVAAQKLLLLCQEEKESIEVHAQLLHSASDSYQLAWAEDRLAELLFTSPLDPTVFGCSLCDAGDVFLFLLELRRDGSSDLQLQWFRYLGLVQQFTSGDPLATAAPLLARIQQALIHFQSYVWGNCFVSSTMAFVVDCVRTCTTHLNQCAFDIMTFIPPLRLIDSANAILASVAPLQYANGGLKDYTTDIATMIAGMAAAKESLLEHSTRRTVQLLLFSSYVALDWSASSASVPLVRGVHPTIWSVVHTSRACLQRAKTLGLDLEAAREYVTYLCRESIAVLLHVTSHHYIHMAPERFRQFSIDVVLFAVQTRRLRGILLSEREYTASVHPHLAAIVELLWRHAASADGSEPHIPAGLAESVWNMAPFCERDLMNRGVVHPSDLMSAEVLAAVVSSPFTLMAQIYDILVCK